MRNGYRYLLAAGFAGIGLLSLVFHAFALQWQPVPTGLPGWLPYVSGVVLVALAVGCQISAVRGWSALGLMVYWLVWVVAHVIAGVHGTTPDSIKTFTVVGAWLGLGEIGALFCGAWLLYIDLSGDNKRVPALADPRIPRILFGLACLIFGVSHFVFADFTSQMVPAWIPGRLTVAYITGAGHSLAGLAILSGVFSRLAATLEAVMMGLFVVLLHIPMVMAPGGFAQLPVTMLFVAISLTASAWAVATSLSDKPWGVKA